MTEQVSLKKNVSTTVSLVSGQKLNTEQTGKQKKQKKQGTALEVTGAID